MTAYPNPTQGMIALKNIEKFGAEFQVRVMDQSGKVLLQIRNASSLNLSHLPNGIYFIEVVSGHQVAHKNIVLNK
ncbi:MAG: T9SS type A sorting domain-containing protein [Bacteroidetes bacterium]|nr:T9SS type A sorting domain-containing protein [Bacteroidota bacterium]